MRLAFSHMIGRWRDDHPDGPTKLYEDRGFWEMFLASEILKIWQSSQSNLAPCALTAYIIGVMSRRIHMVLIGV